MRTTDGFCCDSWIRNFPAISYQQGWVDIKKEVRGIPKSIKKSMQKKYS